MPLVFGPVTITFTPNERSPMETKLGPFTVVRTDPTNKNFYTTQTRGKMYAYYGNHNDYHNEYLQRDGVLRSSCSEPNYPLYGWFNSIEEVHAAYKIYVMEQIIAKYRKDLSENGQALLENPYITFAKDISSEATIKAAPSQEYRPDATDIEINRLQQENWAAKAAYRKSIEALTEEQRKALTEGSWDYPETDAERTKAIADAAVKSTNGFPLVDASAEAISGGKTKFCEIDSMFDALKGKTLSIDLTNGWTVSPEADMSSDDMLDYLDREGQREAAVSDFGPDEAHVDPHQADHEPPNKTADITQNFISQSSQSSGKPFYGCSDDDNPKPTI